MAKVSSMLPIKTVKSECRPTPIKVSSRGKPRSGKRGKGR